MSLTILIIILTCISSFAAFQNKNLMNRMVFSPYAVKRSSEWYRFITSGFIHGNWMHLFFNMYVLFLFGSITENYFKFHYRDLGGLFYVALYLFSIILSEVYSYFQHKDNAYYASLGASGAVSAILFASILFQPLSKIGLIFFPIGIPAFIFGLLYLLYSAYMAKQGQDNIGHNAHFYGAIFGFAFPVVLKPMLIVNFFEQVATGF